MPSFDALLFWALHAALAVLLLVALWKARRRRGPLAILERGDGSMSALALGFAVAATIYGSAVAFSDVGYRLAVVTADYLALGYLFFFNGWTRNKTVRFFNALRKERH